MRTLHPILLIPLVIHYEAVSQDGGRRPDLKLPVPYAHIREADVMWARRVWRLIDLREKVNHPLYYPLEPLDDRMSLFDVIKTALLTDGPITAYDDQLGDGDEFTQPLSTIEVRDILERTEIVRTDDPDTGEQMEVQVVTSVTSADVLYYKIKEDHIFDKQRSEMDIRIIGIAPVILDRGEDGEIRGQRTLFWLYYPECRYLFASWEAFNRHNDAERISFEEVFLKRSFSSTVTRISNVYDRSITDHSTGMDALTGSAEVSQWLLQYEADLWHY